MILVRFSKNSRPAGMAGLMVLSLAIFLKSFIELKTTGGDTGLVAYSDMPFYNLIFGAIHTKPIFNLISTLLFLWILCYMLIRINVRYVLLEFRSFMPATFFLLFSFALPEAQQVSPALVGSIFYLFCFAILFDAPDKRPDTFSIFIAGIMLAVGSMFYLKLIWFIPLIWISLGTLRTVTWRELLYPVIAYLLLGLFLVSENKKMFPIYLIEYLMIRLVYAYILTAWTLLCLRDEMTAVKMGWDKLDRYGVQGS